MKKIELNPCSRCGEMNAMVFKVAFLRGDDGYYIKCNACGCKTEPFEKENGARTAWNKGLVND